MFPAAVLVGLEGVAAAAIGVIEALSIRPERLVVGAGSALLLVAYAALLLGIAWGLKGRRRWTRGPAIATQLIQLPIAWSFQDGATWWVALLLAAAAVAVIVCLVVPSSTAVLRPADPPE